MWNIFENEKQNPTCLEENIECIYTAKQENLCIQCQSPLMIMEEGFPTCMNKECCLIYKDNPNISDDNFKKEIAKYTKKKKFATDDSRC